MIGGRLGVAAVAVCAGLALSGAGRVLPAGDDLVLESSQGRSVGWGDWIADNGPAAVLLWASWAPGSEEAVARLDELSTACREVGLELVVVAVQEPFGDAEKVLGSRSVDWLHDRHGALLKRLRALRVPSLVVVGRDGSAKERLEPAPEAVREWGRR